MSISLPPACDPAGQLATTLSSGDRIALPLTRLISIFVSRVTSGRQIRNNDGGAGGRHAAWQIHAGKVSKFERVEGSVGSR
jgi:hypothetical protein